MAYPVTLCCLLASPRKERQSWQPGFYQVEVAELDTDGNVDPAVAAEFVERLVDTEGLAIGETDTDVLVCALHHGHDIDRAPRIDYADQEVDEPEELRRYPQATTWTVCGMYVETGQCYCGVWSAHGPRMAYAAAFWHCQVTYDRYLVVSCVHPGDQPRGEESPTFADPTCKTADAMESRLDELIPDQKAN